MNLFERTQSFFRHLSGQQEPPALSAPVAAPSTAPREPIDDAAAYGVTVEPATVTPGGWYWQAVRVHHLSPEENGGNHHIYMDVVDPTLSGGTNPYGGRVFNARLKISWDGGEQFAVIDKPLSEPGANFPMWKWQVCAVKALGLPGQELPSDRVMGMHTGHPDEAPGNTLFHHSFSVTFCKVQAPAVIYADSVIYGVLHKGAGRTALLMQGDTTTASQVVGGDEAFRFTDLAAGEYQVGVRDTRFRSDPVRVDGQDQAQLALTLILAESAISGRVRNGAGRTLLLQRAGAEVARQVVPADETYRFTGLTAGNYRVALADTPLRSALIVLDGAAAATADLVAPTQGKPLTHYVLFGPAEQPATEADLLLAQDFLLAFAPSFGFSADEAAHAGLVTIIADRTAVSQESEAALGLDGTPVQRIAGTVAEVATALGARVGAGQPFV
ncbi:MAG: hypothetical protein CVU38_05345 [Chloroflexi bacterium HGW-Chloroflexi-1]|nr:MAG: hypothetical protein CVU38_05345 [Chloroflexi bacterium HGW-Chloroflexi-1]